jgi:hypothetical protein
VVQLSDVFFCIWLPFVMPSIKKKWYMSIITVWEPCVVPVAWYSHITGFI